MLLLKLITFTLGGLLVAGTLFSAIETFILPRSVQDMLTRGVFAFVRLIFAFPLRLARTYKARDRIMAFYAPVSLLTLLPVWYLLISLGFSLMYLASGTMDWRTDLRLSGSSLLTLGFNAPENSLQTLLVFSEATIGLILVALLIAYLPTMYSAFSRRETAVTLLEVRAGNPPSAVEMLMRFQRIHGLDRLSEHWQTWENWFAEQDIPLKANREQAWRDFAGWRVNYDQVLLALARLTMAPPAPWSSDRAHQS